MDRDEFQHDYQKALTAWHVAWQARVDWYREHCYPLKDREQSVVYEEVLAVRQELRDTEDRALEAVESARVRLAEAESRVLYAPPSTPPSR